MPVQIYPLDPKRSIEGLSREINRETDEIDFTVAVIGTEVAVTHDLNRVPTSFHQVGVATTTGQGVVYPGTTAWTDTVLYLTATATGVYSVRVRR